MSLPTYADVVARLERGEFAAVTLGDQVFTIQPSVDTDGHAVSFRDPAAVTKPRVVASRLHGEAGHRWAYGDLEVPSLEVGPFARTDTLPLDENAVAADAQPVDPRRGERAFLAALTDVRRRLLGEGDVDRQPAT